MLFCVKVTYSTPSCYFSIDAHYFDSFSNVASFVMDYLIKHQREEITIIDISISNKMLNK